MHILLTDIITCPRCGPRFGLILQADRVEDRRVVRGRVGCANCRTMYRVEHGVAELGVEQPAASAEGNAPEDLNDEALRVAALLGLREEMAMMVVAGAGAELASRIARLVPGVEVIAAVRALGPEVEAPGVSTLLSPDALPLYDRSVPAVALLEPVAPALLDAGARVLASGGRLLVQRSDPEARSALEEHGLRLLLDEEGLLLAERAPAPSPLVSTSSALR